MTEHQQNLFETDPTPWELDDALEQRIATVVIPSVPAGSFDYLVPDSLLGEAEVGRRVQVPFGRGDRPAEGYLVRLETRRAGTRKLKSLARVIDARRLLSPAMLRLTEWIAEYYLCPWGQVLEAVVPAGVRAQAGTRRATLFSLPEEVRARFATLAKLPERQRAVLAALATSPRPLTLEQLCAAARCTSSPVTTLRKKGLIAAHVERVSNFDLEEQPVERETQLELNEDQRQALASVLATLHAAEHQTVLIRGVTGSGKTEVYMQAIQEVLQFGRQAIVLVPEISLTPQTRERFRRRFDRVAVLHSNLTDVERAWHWERIAAGEVQVVVGARSAIFAPVPHLGLIILDEEHESSFKQGESPRYHAREVAIRRAEAENVPLVLGSATPSLESWQRAVTGAYKLVEMPRRVLNRPLPAVATIDLRAEQENPHSRGAISRPLHQAIGVALRAGGQVILLLNRRGFSTHIQCPACGSVVKCPDCDIALTHHRQKETAVCHYCDFQMPAPVVCPTCQSPGIRYSGRGTQKLEAEIQARFPGEPCLRMDTDSMQKPGDHQRALDRFRRGEVRILLGTQMIAKGLDFPNVTLVGVISADTGLHLADFRAPERTFQLVTQVAGRTGRGEKGGRVLVQTFTPEHPAIQAAVRHDYDRFAQGELPLREQHGYPPFGAMIRIVVRGAVEAQAFEFARTLAARIRAAALQQSTEHTPPVRVLGPAAPQIAKLRGNFRFQIQLQADDGEVLRSAVRAASSDLQPPDSVQWIADVDPMEML